MDDHVHVGHRPGLRRVLLAVELKRRVILARSQVHFFFEHELALDEKSRRAAAGIVHGHARLGVENARHDHADLFWRVELAGAGDAALGEFADEIFVGAADDIGLDVGEPEALLADALDQIAQAVVVEIAHAVGGGVEIDPVDDSLEERVLVGDVAQDRGELLADLVGKLANDRPDRIVGILRLQRQEETDQLFVMLDELERFGARADFLGDAVQLVVENVAEPLREDQRQDVFLVLRRVLRAADRARRIPNPRFERFIAVAVSCHGLAPILRAPSPADKSEKGRNKKGGSETRPYVATGAIK